MRDSVANPSALSIARRDIPAAIQRITNLSKRPHVRTVDRWIKKGSGGVCLEVTYVGHEIFTTEREIRVFLARLTQSKRSNRDRTMNQVQMIPTLSATQAAARLDAMGIV